MADDKQVVNVDLDDLSEDTNDIESEKEEVDDSTQEDVDETSDDVEGSEEDTVDETEDDSEEYVDDAEYLAQYEGMPEGIKDVDGLAKSYLSMLPEMKRNQTTMSKLNDALAAQGIVGGVDSLLDGTYQAPQQTNAFKQTEQSTDGESYFNKTPFEALFKQHEADGSFSDDGVKSSYKGMSSYSDKALSPFIGKMEAVYTTMAQTIMGLQNQMKDVMWSSFDHPNKGIVTKKDAFDVMGRFNMGNLNEVMSYMAYKNPDMFKDIANKAEQRGVKKGQKKLKRFQGGMKKGKSGSLQKFNYKSFQGHDGSWDDNKLNTLPDFGTKMLKQWKKDFETGKIK